MSPSASSSDGNAISTSTMRMSDVPDPREQRREHADRHAGHERERTTPTPISSAMREP